MKKSRFISLFLTLPLLLGSLSACGKDETPSQKGGEPAVKSEASAGKEEAPIELDFLVYAGDTFHPEEGEPVTQYLEDRFNIKINFIVPAITSYEETVQRTLLNGDDLPDLIVFTGADAKFKQAIEDEMLMDLTELLADKENIQTWINDMMFAACSVDGRVYGVPRGTINRHDGLYIRKDWLDKVGLTVDSAGITRDEFTEILRAFTEDDPDGNGINDTFGLAYWGLGMGYPETAVSTAFGLCGWQPDGSGGYYNTELNLKDDNYVDSLLYYGSLYQKGYVTPDSLTQNATDASLQFQQGIAGITGGYVGGYAGNLTELRKLFPEAELTYCAGILDDNGERVGRGFTAGGIWTLSAISADCEHPEVILELMDYCLSDEGNEIMINGLEGVHYTLDGSGEKVFNEKYTEYNSHKGHWPNIVRRQQAQNFIAANMDPDVREKVVAWLNLCADTVKPSCDLGYNPEGSVDMLNLNTEMGELRLNIIRGEATKEDWKAFLKRYYENGYQEIEDLMVEYIKSVLD